MVTAWLKPSKPRKLSKSVAKQDDEVNATEQDNKMCFFGPISLGSTYSMHDTKRLVENLCDITQWGQTEFKEWWKKTILEACEELLNNVLTQPLKERVLGILTLLSASLVLTLTAVRTSSYSYSISYRFHTLTAVRIAFILLQQFVPLPYSYNSSHRFHTLRIQQFAPLPYSHSSSYRFHTLTAVRNRSHTLTAVK